MANKKKKGGRTTPKGTRPPDRRQSRLDDGTPPIVRDAEDACRERSPLALMLMASAFCETLTTRPTDHLRDDDIEQVDAAELLLSFVGSGFPAMVALARAMEIVHPDRDAVAPVAPLIPDVDRPSWAASMEGISITGALAQTEPMGDGDNVAVSFEWPDGSAGTAVVYVDHNMGTIAKDAFVVPLSLAGYVKASEEAAEEDMVTEPIDLADARARIEQAIASFETVWPAVDSDSWPTCRPFVEWVVSHLPEGGTGYQHPQPTVEERAAVHEAFLAECGNSIDGLSADEVGALSAPLIAFACDEGPGDPLRWSPVSVEIVLHWYPDVVNDVDPQLLPRLPEVLECFVVHAHAQRNVAAAATRATLDSIAHWTPEYLAALGEIAD